MKTTDFAGLGLIEPLTRAVLTQGYTTPTPIQAKSIPELLGHADLLGIAQTGSGKTAAFVLPILQHLVKNRGRASRKGALALILAPTRELALQIGESVAAYAKHLRLRHTVILGGVNQRPQVKALTSGVDILVATPGRLLDLKEQQHVHLNDVAHLVLDEADRMLDMGFIKDVRKIVRATPNDRQTLLFSATMPKEISRLANDILFEPVRVDVAPKTITPDKVEQRIIHVPAAKKGALLADLLVDASFQRVIVFTRTKHRANRVAKQLYQAGVEAAAIHGNKSQSARQRALDGFKSHAVRVLVATDIAARGIDIDDVTHVINFDLPNEPESYVHRIGRTARAGADGMAISFCDPAEREHLRDIERLIGLRIKVEEHKLSTTALHEEAPSQRAKKSENMQGKRPHSSKRRGGRNRRRNRAKAA
ncbi:MAG: ATP-dependent RNA helicase RhlE [Alphaproteobacteria bacterium MarineAlpha4_Bin2]|nr:MAG: ATP-dependent RNA helicase RhlE [Alphaproteobacteria bacterium MarineAlpha4_Bin2]